MKISLLIISFLAIGTVTSGRGEALELRKILQGHVTAMGGWRSWNEVASIKLSGTIAQGDESPVDFVMVKKIPKQIRVTVTVPVPYGKEDETLQFIRALDNENAWMAIRPSGTMPLDKKPLNDSARDDLIAESIILPELMHYMQTADKLEITEAVKRPDNTYQYKIAVFPERKTKDNYYVVSLNDKDFFVSSIETIKDGSMVATKWLEDYTDVDGIKHPTKIRTSSAKARDSILQIENITKGVGIYDEYFEQNKPKNQSLEG